MAAFSLPKSTDEEMAARNQAIQDATKEATLIPFSVLEKAKEAAEMALTVAQKGNENSLSDSGVAGLAAAAAAEGALYNVMINLESIEDEEFKEDLAKKAIRTNKEVQKTAAKIKKIMHTQWGIG
jgi:formiminotetrahydrofolate cyclodeaminase